MLASSLSLAVTIALMSAALMAGVYFAFSVFVMRSLNQLPATQAADAMNAINRVILQSGFMVLFFGSTLLYAGLSAIALFSTELAGRWLLFLSGMLYVVGMFVCTAMFNVPLNNRLASTESDDSAKASVWEMYYSRWTRWNHLRGICSLVAALLSLQYIVYYL